MKFLPERKKAGTSEKKSRLSANITLSVPLSGAAPAFLLRQKQLDLLLHTLELLFFGIRERRVILQRKRTGVPDHSKLLV